jgi:hypothetical protein
MIKFISMKKKFVLVFVLFLNTMLCFSQTSPISNGNWQDPTIWPGSQIPVNSDDIVIPSGTTIDLTGNISVKSITINGTLQAISGADIQVTTELYISPKLCHPFRPCYAIFEGA